MRCVKISDKGRVKKWSKRAKIRFQDFEKISKARIYYYTWPYEVCQNKQQGEGQKGGQKCQNMRQLETAIYQAKNKFLTNFQRLQFTTIHGYMSCVKISNKRRVKKWCKSAKM